MYSSDDIVGFVCAFYGCLFAGVVPVPIHPPVQKDVSFCLPERTQNIETPLTFLVVVPLKRS